MGKILQLMYSTLTSKSLLAAVVLMSSILTSVPEVYASGSPVTQRGGAGSQKISLSVQNASLEDVLLLLKQKSNYYFLYNSNAVRKISGITLKASNASIETILTSCLKPTPFEYTIKDGTIVIKAKPGQEAFVEAADKEEARKHVITGRVISKQTKEPLAGVTVYVKGGRHGDVTNSQGEYQLVFEPLAEPHKTIIAFSFIGMEGQEYVYTGQSQINTSLNESTAEVDNVVVTGYVNIRKESFTGNTVSIDKDDLQKVSKTNVMKAIQAFDPSFRIRENSQWGSDPNSLPEVYIRGESGIGTKELDRDELSKSNLKDNPNLPIFIMDGFQISAQKLYDMDINRIENVTILKDAAATAMYGSRAANGVVVITTVAPTPGKLNVSYSMVGDVVTPDLSDYNLMNASEKLQLELMAGCFDVTRNPSEHYQVELSQEYYAKLANVTKGVDTYWLAKPLRTAFNHKHSIYVDGGTDAFRFGVDFQYASQDGVMKGSKRDRIGAGFYIQYIYKNLSIKNYASFLQTDATESPYGDYSRFTTALPYDEFLDENGNYYEEMKKWDGGHDVRVNPLYESGLKNFNKTKNQEFINNLSLNWNITPYLLIKGQLSITKGIDDSDIFLDPLSKQNGVLSTGALVSGSLSTSRGNGTRYDGNLLMAFNRSFNGHNINAQAGGNLLTNTSTSLRTEYRGFPSGTLNSPNYAQRLEGKPQSSESTERTIGFLAAVNYSYQNIYLLDASCRFDGNSAFGKNKRFAPFWSGGLGLNIHNYKFMKDSFITLLKVRGSYGQTGKINFPAYAARTTYSILSDQWYKTGSGSILKALGNSDLSWETTNTFDVGFELGFWQDRIYTKFSYYNKLTKDLINDVTIPSSTGFTTYRDNIGEIRNRGVEVDLRIIAVRTKDLFLAFNANLAHNQNRLMKVSESLKEYNRRVQQKINEGSIFNDGFMSKPMTQYVEGVSTNSIWGMKSLGINPATGEEVFMTLDGRIVNTWLASQQQVLGVKDPKIQGSFGFNLVWKQFAVYASFLYEAGGQRYNQTLADKVEGVSIYQSNVDRRVLQDRWSYEGQNALYKKMEPGRTGVEKTRATSRFVQDYNMLQLNSLTLSYDFKKSTIAPLRLSMLRLEVGANDLFNASSVKQERGLSYPYARTFTFSVKVAF